jgi:hypothetical protein
MVKWESHVRRSKDRRTRGGGVSVVSHKIVILPIFLVLGHANRCPRHWLKISKKEIFKLKISFLKFLRS